MSPARHSWVSIALVLVVDSILVFGAIGVALRVPSVQSVTGLARGAVLDYARSMATISPLADAFIEEVLGVEAAPPSTEIVPMTAGGTQSSGGDTAATYRSPATDAHLPTNDDFENARPVQNLPYEARTTTNTSTREQGEPSSCAPPIGGTLWYRFTPEEDMVLVADTYGSDHAAALAVYSGSKLPALTEVACRSDLHGLAVTPFVAVAGQTYHFQVSAPTRDLNTFLSKGHVVFRLARQGWTSLVSTGDLGQSDGDNGWPAISGDGRHVVFQSVASNLDRRDSLPCPNNTTCTQLYVRDLKTGTTRMVSISSDGQAGNAASGGLDHRNTAALSHDGRYVAFASKASNLVEGDTNACSPGSFLENAFPAPSCADVFVHDRDADGDGVYDEQGAVETMLVSVSSEGEQGDDFSNVQDISPDGRFVVFTSAAANLDGEDPRCHTTDPPYLELNCADVYRHDRDADQDGIYDEEAGIETIRVSVSSTGEPGDHGGGGGSVSADGRYVAFMSQSTNLVRATTPTCDADYASQKDSREPCSGIFVHDTKTRRTVRVSVSSQGEASNGKSGRPYLSADGRFVAFLSQGSNLVEGDGPVCTNRLNGGRSHSCSDVFVHDRDADEDGKLDESPKTDSGAIATVLASVSSTGEQADREVGWAAMSEDGSTIVFKSSSTNLVPHDDNDDEDVFVRFLRTGETIRVSVSNDGATTGGGDVGSPGVSANGGAFTWSAGTRLSEEDVSPHIDVFVHELWWRR